MASRKKPPRSKVSVPAVKFRRHLETDLARLDILARDMLFRDLPQKPFSCLVAVFLPPRQMDRKVDQPVFQERNPELHGRRHAQPVVPVQQVLQMRIEVIEAASEKGAIAGRRHRLEAIEDLRSAGNSAPATRRAGPCCGPIREPASEPRACRGHGADARISGRASASSATAAGATTRSATSSCSKACKA